MGAEGVEPPPAGERAVIWAQPRAMRGGVKIKLLPARTTETIGEMRFPSAILLQPGSAGEPSTAPRRGPGCRAWLQTAPTGFVCQDEVNLRPGYLSDPPRQESPSSWRSYRYGVVKSPVASLRGAGSGDRYLRSPLHQGDGITVVRERDGQLQLYGRQWLSKNDVELVEPPALDTIDLAALPAQQRLLVAWAVPPPGDSAVAMYPAQAPGNKPAPPVLLPRYSLLLVADTAPAATPGRIAVTLPETTRAALTAVAGPPVLRTDLQSGAFEIDASHLRRITPPRLPPDLKPGEHWIDISLSEQVAVAYVGQEPSFAALVSTGKHATAPGSFFIYRKYLTQTMANLRGAASQYDYREVPHAQFFDGRIGMHAVLWHDLLGHPVSHGCVNLSPAAAAQFFAFTSPEAPPGWHSITGYAPQPAASVAGSDATPRIPPGRFSHGPRVGEALRGTRVIVRR